MSVIYTGPGTWSLATTGLAGGAAGQIVYPYAVFSATLAQEASTENAEAYRGGKRVIDTVLEASVQTTLTLSTQLNNWQTTGLGLNQRERTETAVVIPFSARQTVPLSAPFEINDPLIVTGNLTSVIAAVEEPGIWGVPGALIKVSVAPAADREYQAVVGKIIFDESMAGADITYMGTRSITAKTYGGAGSLSKIGDMQFIGEVYDSSGQVSQLIQLPQIAVSSRPSFEFSGGVLEVEITFNCSTPAGWDEPFRYIDVDSLVAA